MLFYLPLSNTLYVILHSILITWYGRSTTMYSESLHKYYLQRISALKAGRRCYQIIYRVLYSCKQDLVLHLFSVLNLCKQCILFFFFFFYLNVKRARGWYFPDNYVHQGSMNSCWILSVVEGVGVYTGAV